MAKISSDTSMWKALEKLNMRTSLQQCSIQPITTTSLTDQIHSLLLRSKPANQQLNQATIIIHWPLMYFLPSQYIEPIKSQPARRKSIATVESAKVAYKYALIIINSSCGWPLFSQQTWYAILSLANSAFLEERCFGYSIIRHYVEEPSSRRATIVNTSEKPEELEFARSVRCTLWLPSPRGTRCTSESYSEYHIKRWIYQLRSVHRSSQGTNQSTDHQNLPMLTLLQFFTLQLPLSRSREDLILATFTRLDSARRGSVATSLVMKRYDERADLEVISGRMSEEEARLAFISSFQSYLDLKVSKHTSSLLLSPFNFNIGCEQWQQRRGNDN